MSRSIPQEKVVIIGGGPAGLSAAIYLARAGLEPLVFAGSPPGGQLTLTSEVENYPGYESILGPELIEKMRKQAAKFGARIVDENVAGVDFSQKNLKITLNNSVINKIYSRDQLASRQKSGPVAPRSYSKFEDSQRRSLAQTTDSFVNFIASRSVIIATGAKALWLGLESETRLRGKGVSACATCDGFFFRGKTVAVVGGGDTALEEGLTLTKFASKVIIIHRRDQFRASKVMQERVFRHPKIKVIWNATVTEILGQNKVEGIKIQVKSQKSKVKSDNLPVQGVFIAIGHQPDTEVFVGKVLTDQKGYIVNTARLALELVKVKSQKSKVKSVGQSTEIERAAHKFNPNYQTMTSVEGVFAAGDCVDYVYRQAATAVGTGVAAALEVEKWLEN